MNFLEICQRTARECSVTGSGPSTVVGQTGELGRIVNWCATAAQEIENHHPGWTFLRSSASFATVSGTAIYPLGTGAGTVGVAASGHRMWLVNTFRNYPTATGVIAEFPMEALDYDVWRDNYAFGANRFVTTRPWALAVGPNKQICLGPYPDGNYTITGDYIQQSVLMDADADEPLIPAEFHMIIVYKAMMMYAGYESAPEVYERGEMNFQRMLAQLEVQFLPRMVW